MERNHFLYSITSNIELVSYKDLAVTQRTGKLPLFSFKKNRPLVLLFTWLDAKPKHSRKFVDLYLNKGFDVLKVSISMWQAMWPVSGAQVTASDVLQLLFENEAFQPLFVHGFSAGTYLWSEVLVKASKEMEKYRPVLDRVKGQVFDSPPSTPPDFQKGFAIAVFPNSPFLSFLFEYIITLQLYFFYNAVTKHLIKGHQAALNPPIKVPSLMLISKDDPIAPFNPNMDIVKAWRSNGIQAHVKWWEHSPHVGHFVHHQEEYMEHLNSLLESIGLNNLKEEKEIESKSN